MKKFVCSVCGYVHVGDSAPAECPICHAGADKFVEQKDGELEWAAEHVVTLPLPNSPSRRKVRPGLLSM